MTDPLSPSFERAHLELKKDGVRFALMTIAEWQTKNPADAVELVQEALAMCSSELSRNKT